MSVDVAGSICLVQLLQLDDVVIDLELAMTYLQVLQLVYHLRMLDRTENLPCDDIPSTVEMISNCWGRCCP